MKSRLMLCVFFFFCLASVNAFAEEEGTEHSLQRHGHEKYVKRENPVPMSDSSVSKGKKLYERHCIPCHGESGKGGIGPALSDTSWIHGGSDGEIFQVITEGIKGTAMKGFKRNLTVKMRWHLVNYIKSLGKAGGSGQK